METLSPGSAGSSGELVDPDGRSWTVRRRHLPLETVRGMLKRDDRPVLLGESGGSSPRWVPADERAALWDRIRGCYASPGSGGRCCEVEYMGLEFAAADGSRLLYVEEWC